MNEIRSWDDEELRYATARRLQAAIRDQTSNSFDRMTTVAEGIKLANPELAEQIDRVVGHSMIRTMLMPEAMAALFLAQTEPPPVVVEGEVVEESSAEDEPPEEGREDE